MRSRIVINFYEYCIQAQCLTKMSLCHGCRLYSLLFPSFDLSAVISSTTWSFSILQSCSQRQNQKVRFSAIYTFGQRGLTKNCQAYPITLSCPFFTKEFHWYCVIWGVAGDELNDTRIRFPPKIIVSTQEIWLQSWHTWAQRNRSLRVASAHRGTFASLRSYLRWSLPLTHTLSLPSLPYFFVPTFPFKPLLNFFLNVY